MKLKKEFKKIVSMNESPHAIASGFAVGTFVEMITPIPGFDFLLAFVAILLFPKLNRISLLAPVVVLNSAITWPIYGLSYKIGDVLFGASSFDKYDAALLNNVFDVSRRFIIGNFIVSVAMAVLFYFIVYLFARIYQNRNKK